MNWDLKLIYESEEAFQKDLQFVKESINKYEEFKGTLTTALRLEELYTFDDEVSLTIEKLFSYASMNFDLDQKNTKALERYQVVYNLYMQLVQATSFVNSEIINLGENKILSFIEENKNLKKYTFNLKKLFNNKEHVLPADKEHLLSYYQAALSNYNNLYDKLAVSDNNSVIVKISTGEELEINESNFRGYLATLKNQDDRRLVFEAIYKFYDMHKNTFAAIYQGIIQTNVAEMHARNYDSILNLFLENNNIPNAVFLNLIEMCKENTEPIKRYYKLRKDFFKIEKLHTYDRFLELSSYAKKYSYEEAKEILFAAIKTIGGDFEKKAHAVLADGRVDVAIKPAKRTGAYSTGTYKEGPFILLNFNNTLDDVFTLAHEAGHSIHTMYSNESQPSNTSNYTIFVAEVASTFNEQLLLDYLLKNSQDVNLKIVILQNAIDGLIATFYRQALFADYEYQAHNLGVNNEPITWESLSSIMKNLYLKYYGIDLNEEAFKEFVWCYIPHLFHSPFYVYQYATSFASSLAIYSKVKKQEANALDNYITLLKSGGSDYPILLLKKAGVDLTKRDAFKAVVERINYLVDELAKLIKED